jgi:hypothetical protein
VHKYRVTNFVMDAPSNLPTLVEAFPPTLEPHVRAVVAIMPTPSHQRSPDDIAQIALNGHPLRIPARIYHPELRSSDIASLSQTERSIAACLYTRHHDGHVRQRALSNALDIDEVWATPFVVQLLGEYVIEWSRWLLWQSKALPRLRSWSFFARTRAFSSSPVNAQLVIGMSTIEADSRDAKTTRHCPRLRLYVSGSRDRLPNQPLQPTTGHRFSHHECEIAARASRVDDRRFASHRHRFFERAKPEFHVDWCESQSDLLRALLFAPNLDVDVQTPRKCHPRR